MKPHFLILVIVGLFCSVSQAQITSLSDDSKPGVSIEGDYTLLVTKLPIKLTAEAGGSYYDWDFRYNVEADESLNTCTIKETPDGDYIVKVKVLTIDFEAKKTTIREEQIKFRLRARSQIDDPDDTDPNPIDPIPDPRPSIKNDYWVGLAAFDNAPKGDGIAKRLAKVYRQSAEYLETNPPKKALWLEDDKDNKDPEKSVLAWQKQEAEKITGNKPGWVRWSEKVNEAFRDAQMKLPKMTRVEWAVAFREISQALEAVS